MIKYNPKEWFSLIFRFHKSDTFRILVPSMILIAVYSFVVALWELTYLKVTTNGTALHSLLGFVLSLLLVFRTNTAYERWWEGRRLWGSLVNNSRNLASKLQALIPAEHADYRKTISVLISNYAIAVKDHLRSEASATHLDDAPYFDPESLNGARHLPNALSAKLFSLITELKSKGILTSEDLLFINEELRSFNDITGGCERIKATPIPYSYSIFLKKFIFVYIMTLPFGFVSTFGFYIIPIVVFVFYVLTSLELIAEEIEDPFGKDSNDLPTDEIALRIKMNVNELLQ